MNPAFFRHQKLIKNSTQRRKDAKKGIKFFGDDSGFPLFFATLRLCVFATLRLCVFALNYKSKFGVGGDFLDLPEF